MSGLYENDKIAWAKQQIEYLKNDKLDLVDIEHVIEELEDMLKTNWLPDEKI